MTDVMLRLKNFASIGLPTLIFFVTDLSVIIVSNLLSYSTVKLYDNESLLSILKQYSSVSSPYTW